MKIPTTLLLAFACAFYTNHDSKGRIVYANIYGRVKHGL
jgi:hypothetical protein